MDLTFGYICTKRDIVPRDVLIQEWSTSLKHDLALWKFHYHIAMSCFHPCINWLWIKKRLLSVLNHHMEWSESSWSLFGFSWWRISLRFYNLDNLWAFDMVNIYVFLQLAWSMSGFIQDFYIPMLPVINGLSEVNFHV